MFCESYDITEIDLSKFYTEKVDNMANMFKYCYNLEKINFGNMDTSKVTNMEGLFFSCASLKSFDLSNFDTSSLENAKEMFSSCSALTSLNLNNFKTIKLKNMNNMFSNCVELISIDLSNFDTSNVEDMRGLFYQCSKMKYADLHSFKASSLTDFGMVFCFCYNMIYINLKNFKLNNIDNIQIDNLIQFTSSDLKFCIEDLETQNLLLLNDKVNCSDFCFQENVNYEPVSGQCICKYGYKMIQVEFNKYICSDTVPENYYLDNTDNIYKQCYHTCKRCSQKGDEINNKCDSCIEGYKFLNELLAIQNNCYIKCDYNYYFNQNNKYECTSSNSCPLQYNKLIINKKKCIDDCLKDDENIYDYNNECYNQCPQETKTYEKEKICLDSCKAEQFEYNNICYDDCPNNTYRIFMNRNICVINLPEDYYLDIMDNIYKKCFNTCKTCGQSGNEIIHNCNECLNGYKFINDSLGIPNNCYVNCVHNYYFDEYNKYKCTESNSCTSRYNKLITIKKKCIDDCRNDDEYIYKYNNECYKQCPDNKKIYKEQKLCLDECYPEQFEYNNICYNDCPINTCRIFINRNICITNPPENYYLDIIDSIYKKCYTTCKTCKQSGNDNIHNCNECINGYKFINDSSGISNNCYVNCEYNYYFDESNQYECTQTEECPSNRNKLITLKNKCIDDCKKDSDYIYEYNYNCLKQCSQYLKIDFETKHCLPNCSDNQILFDEICYNDFPNDNSQIFQDGKIVINNLTNFDDLLNNIILSAYSPEIGNNLVIDRPDETVYQITNSKNEMEFLKNKSKNICNTSIIDLGQCEILLKKENNISENDSLIFIKSEIKTNKASEKSIKYDAYNPYNKEKLNLSLCEEVPINIYVPMELSIETKQLYDQMKNSGYNMFDINDPFYQDICTPFDSPDGTDMILADRIDYIYHNNDTQCQSNCKYSQYSIESRYLSCSCSVDENANLEHKKSDKFNAKKIYESFYEVLKYSNYDILKCYNIILDINVIKTNMGSIIVILYFSSYLICLFIFIFRGIIPLKIKLRYNLYTEQKKYNLNFKFNIQKVLNHPNKRKYKPKIISIKKNLNQKQNEIIFNNNILKFSSNNKSNIGQKLKLNSNSNSILNVLDKNPIKKIEGLFKFNKKAPQKKPKRDYSDYELNELEYEEAVKLDKRSLFKIYWQTLQREHLIFFTFFNCNDYNLLSVKISRFVFLIVGDMAFNVFFFSDDSMHKLFLSYGKYDFIQQIPQITYSTIISQIIEVFLCFLSLTDKYIYQIKSNLIDGNTKNIKDIVNCMRIKLIIFFVFVLIFFVIYWYIISVFCGVYRNTQKSFIKDSIISFSISLIYPFISYFVSACLRICSLRNSKKKAKCVYNFSYAIPFF